MSTGCLRRRKLFIYLCCLITVLTLVHLNTFTIWREYIKRSSTKLCQYKSHSSDIQRFWNDKAIVNHSHDVDYLLSKNKVGFQQLEHCDCRKKIEGDHLLHSKEAYSHGHRIYDQTFIEITNDCETFRLKFGYGRHSVSNEEKNFPIAFNILLYKDVDQLHFLLRAIYRSHNLYCLHVDALAEQSVFRATERLARCLNNVYLVHHREKIIYSGFSRLQADINCMKDHWMQSVHWNYLINLPSQNFPLKTNLEMVMILKIYNGSNDIEGITKRERMMTNRYAYKHVYRSNDGTRREHIVRTDQKLESPPYNISVVKGSAYGIFSRNFVDFILHDRLAEQLLNWSRMVNSPDEYYWSTLHHNRHLKAPGGYSGMEVLYSLIT